MGLAALASGRSIYESDRANIQVGYSPALTEGSVPKIRLRIS